MLENINVNNRLSPLRQDTGVVVGLGAGKGLNAPTQVEDLFFPSFLWLHSRVISQQGGDNLANEGNTVICLCTTAMGTLQECPTNQVIMPIEKL